MDTLVARYSRPTYQQNEPFSEQDQQDFCDDSVPSLSLRFAVPPVAHVSLVLASNMVAFSRALSALPAPSLLLSFW
jgi:hypothetical protein